MFVELEHATHRPRKESTKSVCAYLVFYVVVLFILLICKIKTKKSALKNKSKKAEKLFYVMMSLYRCIICLTYLCGVMTHKLNSVRPNFVCRAKTQISVRLRFL